VPVSEDFSHIPDARGHTAHTGGGGTDPGEVRASSQGRSGEQDIPVNHSEFFAPVIEPTLSVGTLALVVAALTYLAK